MHSKRTSYVLSPSNKVFCIIITTIGFVLYIVFYPMMYNKWSSNRYVVSACLVSCVYHLFNGWILHEESTLHIRKCRLTWVIVKWVAESIHSFIDWLVGAMSMYPSIPYKTLMIPYICQSTEWRLLSPWGTTNPLRSTESCLKNHHNHGRWWKFLDWNYRLTLCEDNAYAPEAWFLPMSQTSSFWLLSIIFCSFSCRSG